MEPGKDRERVEARCLLCYWATTELGMSQTELSKRIPLKQPATSNALRRGAREATLGGELQPVGVGLPHAQRAAARRRPGQAVPS